VDRESQESRGAPDSADRHRRLRAQIVDHFVRFENVALDLDEWSDLTVPRGAGDGGRRVGRADGP
jgi:hypothetical protein